jgi:hypothetical protein
VRAEKPGTTPVETEDSYMAGPFIFVATNKVRDGRLEAEKRRVPGWIDLIQSNEPRLIAFHEDLSEDGTEVEYVQVHPDTDSFENHMRVVESSGRAYTETLEGTTNIRIYGTPSEAILEMLSQAAGFGVPMTVLPEHLGGFTR